MAANDKDHATPVTETSSACIDGNDKEAPPPATNSFASFTVNSEETGSPANKTDGAPPTPEKDTTGETAIDETGAVPPAVDDDTGVEANKKDTATPAVDEDTAKMANNKEAAPRAVDGNTSKEENNKDSGKTKAVGERQSDEESAKSDSSAEESEDAETETRDEKGTPTLDKLGINLTKLAQEGKLNPFEVSEELVDRVIQILCRQGKCSPCLIGHPGIWKTAIIEKLAQRVQSGTVPERLKEKKIISIASNHPESKKYPPFMFSLNIINEVKRSGDIIIFFDECLTLSNSIMLKPALEKGDIMCIGATKTIGEYTNDRSMIESVFQAVKVPEPSIEDAIKILRGHRGIYETHHKISYTDEAFIAAVKLSSRYMSDGFLLDKAKDLIDEAGSRALLLQAKAIKTKNMDQDSKVNQQNSTIKTETDTIMETNADEIKENEPMKVTKVDVQQIVSSQIGIPVREISKEESERLLKLEETLHESIIGQHEALVAISDAIRRARVGLKSSKRPIASFLFTGPTGVGKTEVAKTLARQYFGAEDSMIRFDMSEYMERHEVSKLIGSPPGYVMCEEGGQLTEAVKRKPHTIVLFDEIEKAHPDIMNIMLQILDDGRLTDNKGETVTFSNTIIIMTSNVGGNVFYSEKSSGIPQEKIYDLVMREIKKNFRAEFLNRFDEIIIFKQLSKGEVNQIADLIFKEVDARLKAKDIRLNMSDKFRERVVNDGYSPNYGARQLRRAITTLLENPLAKKILSKEIKEGDSALMDVDALGMIQVLKEPSSVLGE